MILALSTSSPWLSAAVGREGLVIADARQESHRRASEELIALVDKVLAAANVELDDLSGIVVDVGPGGFTSVRVGVTVAKMWAEFLSRPLWSITAFDLIAPGGQAGIAGRANQILVKADGASTVETWPDVPGYGWGKDAPTFPDARRAFEATAAWKEVDPRSLVPDYIHPPQISQPKQPFAGGTA